MKELTEEQLDALREVGNIGAGNASNALSQMIMKNVTIRVPRAYIIPIEEISNLMGDPQEMVLAAFFKVLGDARGNILITFSKEQALYLSNTLLGKGDDPEFITEEKESALQELGNILASSYLTALSTFIGINLIPSIPHISYDMAGALVDLIQIELAQKVEKALVIETEFLMEAKSVVGHFFAFFDHESFSVILNALGMQK
jgi:chemotaxis protein CheC